MLQSNSDGAGKEFQQKKNQVVGESKENIKEAEDTLKVHAKWSNLMCCWGLAFEHA